MSHRAAILATTLGLFCLLAGQGSAAPARQQVLPIRPIPPVGPSPITADCRYLFVVDTSVTMQRYADGLYRTVHRHIATGLGGRMQDGDIFTVWTYADAVLTREFPLNAWTAELNIALANRTYEYLATRKFAGKSNLRPVFAELGQALAISTNLTIILISDGTDVVVGTPFDRPINVTYGKRASELRTAKMPFVTALVTQRGEFTHWSVRGGLEDINLPVPVRNPFPMPVLAEVPPQSTPAPVSAPVPIASPPTPPVVVTPAPKPVATNVVAAAATKPIAPVVVPPPPVAATAPQTNSPPPKPTPAAPVPVPAVVSAPPPKAPAPAPAKPPMVAVNTNRLTTIPVPAVKPSDVPPPKSAPAAAPAPKLVTNTVAAVSPVPKAPAPPAPVKPPEPAPAPPLINPVPKSAPPQSPVAPKPPAPSAPVPAKSSPPSTPPTPPVVVTNAPKVAVVSPPPKPIVAPEPKATPAPVIKPKETLILPAIPPAPQPVIPPALRQPKSLIEASNVLAKVELLRPPTVSPTSSVPARPLEARVLDPKPAPAPKTNPPVVAVATKPLPVSVPPTPVPAVKPTTNAALTLPPPPKAVAVLAPPAPSILTNVVTSKTPGNTLSNAVVPPSVRESMAKNVTNPPAPGGATNRAVTTNAATAKVLPPAKPGESVNAKTSQVATASVVTRSNILPVTAQPPVNTGVKASSVTNRLAKPAGGLAVAAPRGNVGGWVYLGAAIGLLALAGGIITYLLRPQPNPSVISQSITHTPETPPK